MSIATVPRELVAPVAPAGSVEALDEMPLPRDLHSFLLMAILIILVLYSLYFISEVVLPIFFAFVLYLLLQPSMRWFAKLHVPRTIAALMIIGAFFGGLAALGLSLSGPAAAWIAKAPDTLPHLEKRLSIFKKPVEDMQKATKQVEKMGEDPSPGVAQRHRQGAKPEQLLVQRHAGLAGWPADHNRPAVLLAGFGRSVPPPAGRDPADAQQQEAGGRYFA
jgi:hypothetical protein